MSMRTALRSVTQIHQLINAQEMEAEFVILGTLGAMKKGEEHVWQTGITKTVSNSVTAAKEIMCVIMKDIVFACCIGTVRTAQNIVTTALRVTNAMIKAIACVQETGTVLTAQSSATIVTNTSSVILTETKSV